MPAFHPSRYVFRTLSEAVLISLLASPSSAQVVLNEFLFRDADTRLEFVEILNHSTTDVDLIGFQLSDERRRPVPITTQSVILKAGGYAVLVRDGAAFDVRFSADRIEPSSWPALNNGGDTVLLWSKEQVVDSVSFDGTWGSIGRSMERIDPHGPSAGPANWRPSNDPSGATPGYRNSVFLPDETPPVITEVEEWTDGSIIVYVSEPLDPATLPYTIFRFHSGDLPQSLRLSSDGRNIVLTPWPGSDLGSLTVDGLTDAAGNRAGFSGMTVARQPKEGDLTLNEILFEPRADAFDGHPDQSEFVEIRSGTTHPLAIRGIYLTGRPTETGSSDTLRIEAAPKRIQAGGYGVLHALGPSGTGFGEAFPSIPPETLAVRAPIRRQTLLLDNTGDTVRLNAAGGAVLDEVTYSSSWHLPELPSTTGVSLERISPSAPSDDPSNWTSSVSPEGGTPGRENSVAITAWDPRRESLSIAPSPFSPDGNGWEDFARIDVKTGRPISTIAVWIFDSAGRLVRRLSEASLVGSESSFVWDGRNDTGGLVPTGIFIVYVEAVDTSAGDVRRFRKPVVVARSM